MNIQLLFQPMPISVDGVASEIKENESYLVVINSALNQKEREEATIHEILHILRNDFHTAESINAIERRTHTDAELLTKLYL